MKLTHCILFSAMFSAPLVQAAENVQWADLPRVIWKAEQGGSTVFTVVAKSGEKKKGWRMLIPDSGVRFEPDPLIHRDQIFEIQVRHRGHLSYFGRVFPRCDECVRPPSVLLIVPVDLAFGTVATPPMLVVESVRRLMPAKILKIVP